jgi:uncharacterized protein YqhQ
MSRSYTSSSPLLLHRCIVRFLYLLLYFFVITIHEDIQKVFNVCKGKNGVSLYVSSSYGPWVAQNHGSFLEFDVIGSRCHASFFENSNSNLSRMH